eukprot:COSAG02_NODE_247_length_27137_cov_61.275057_18_plen_246_part_00
MGGGRGWECVASAASALVVLASACAAVTAPPAPPASTLGWTTEILTTANGAQCLDGTPPGYHIQHRDPGSWSMHLQGGGWCVGEGSCAGRAVTALGSSKSYRKDMDAILGKYDGGAHGIFSSDPVVNPDFHNFTKAYIRYCDGGSFSGNANAPIKVSTKAFKGNMVRRFELPSARIEFSLSLSLSQRWHACVLPAVLPRPPYPRRRARFDACCRARQGQNPHRQRLLRRWSVRVPPHRLHPLARA